MTKERKRVGASMSNGKGVSRIACCPAFDAFADATAIHRDRRILQDEDLFTHRTRQIVAQA
jgi:hypothetical protein